MDRPSWWDALPHEMATELSSQVYLAAVGIFERAETRNIVHGNGHHMAQELALKALELWRERLIDKEVAA